jgi:hypothetical protein
VTLKTGQGADYEGESVRHLYGIALAVIMTAVMFFAGAWGYLQLLKLPLPSGQATALPAGGGSLLLDGAALFALAVLVASVALAGVLAVVPRFSPLAAGLPGLLLVAWTVLYLVSVRRAVDFIPLRSNSFGAGWEGLLFHGILGAVGAVMSIPLVIPSRWRAPRTADGADAAEPVSDAGDYPDDGPPRPTWEEERRQGEPAGDLPLVGIVVGSGRPAASGARWVDTTRVTGASRALRNTGSFRLAPGAQPRATGSFRAAEYTRPLNWPDQRPTDE